MAGTGDAATGWAAKLKASLGTAPPGPAPAPERAPPKPERERRTPEPPAADAPAMDAPAANLLLSLAAPRQEEPAVEAPPAPSPEAGAPDAPSAFASLLDAINPPRGAEPQPTPGPVPPFPLLEEAARRTAVPGASPLLDFLRSAEEPDSPVIRMLSRLPPRPAPPQSPASPSPLLDALRTTPAEPVPGSAAGEAPPPLPPAMQDPAAESAASAPLPPAKPAGPRPAAEAAPAALPPTVPKGPAPAVGEPPQAALKPSRAPQPAEAAVQAARPPLPEREIRAVFEVLVGRPPEEAEMLTMRAFTQRTALRGFILSGTAFREAVLAPAIAAAMALQSSGLVVGDLDVLEALGAGAMAEPGMVVDWFGLRTPLAIAPELADHAGGVLPRPGPSDPRAPAVEWIGLAASVAGATGTWRGLSVGAGRGDLLLAGAVAARRRGLTAEPHASEEAPKAFAALLQHAEANGITPAPGHFQQARIGANPEAAPPPSASVQSLLEGAEAWDWVRISARGAVSPLLRFSLPLLGERVRVLSLVTHSRREEAQAITALARGGWRLLAELPVALRRRNPEAAERNGVQVWRSGLV